VIYYNLILIIMIKFLLHVIGFIIYIPIYLIMLIVMPIYFSYRTILAFFQENRITKKL